MQIARFLQISQWFLLLFFTSNKKEIWLLDCLFLSTINASAFTARFIDKYVVVIIIIDQWFKYLFLHTYMEVCTEMSFDLNLMSIPDL